MILLKLALGFGIGLSLGLLGGGGSILTAPALVHLVEQTPHYAVTTTVGWIWRVNFIAKEFQHGKTEDTPQSTTKKEKQFSAVGCDRIGSTGGSSMVYCKRHCHYWQSSA